MPEEKSWREEVSLAAEIGGPDFPYADLLTALSQQMRRYCTGDYSPEIKGIALVARVEASLKSYGLETVDRVRRNKKYCYIGADIVIPKERWQTQTRQAFAGYLAARVEEGLVACMLALKKQRVQINERQLLLDFESAKAAFLAGVADTSTTS